MGGNGTKTQQYASRGPWRPWKGLWHITKDEGQLQTEEWQAKHIFSKSLTWAAMLRVQELIPVATSNNDRTYPQCHVYKYWGEGLQRQNQWDLLMWGRRRWEIIITGLMVNTWVDSGTMIKAREGEACIWEGAKGQVCMHLTYDSFYLMKR